MRILHVNTESTWRGGERQTLLLADTLARGGDPCTIAARAGGPLADRARAAGLRTIPLAGGPSALLALAVASREHDVVHVHASRALGLAMLAAGRAPILYTRRVDFTPGRDPLTRLKYGRAALIACLSRRIAEVLEDWGVAPGHLRLIPSATPPYVRPDAGRLQALREELSLPEGAPVVGNIAALVGHKDHETLLLAARLVLRRRPDARFVIVGDGPLRAALRDLARDLGISEAVRFAGFRKDALDFYPLFDVFCLSSAMEGLGSAVLDSYSAGVPVVATAAGGIPEIVTDGVTGRLAPPRSPELLAGALDGALDDPPSRARWAEAASRLAREEHAPERMAGRYREVYTELTED
jgi:glycosyltransferase involved in cell wall biosynthesis